MNLRAIALCLAISSPVFATVVTPHQAQAASDSETCPPYERKDRLTSKPLLVNPGGKCYVRFRFSFMLYSSEDFPDVCYFARVAGSEKDYGPFCADGANLRMEVPGPIE
jgi:hypothetical protein